MPLYGCVLCSSHPNFIHVHSIHHQQLSSQLQVAQCAFRSTTRTLCCLPATPQHPQHLSGSLSLYFRRTPFLLSSTTVAHTRAHCVPELPTRSDHRRSLSHRPGTTLQLSAVTPHSILPYLWAQVGLLIVSDHFHQSRHSAGASSTSRGPTDMLINSSAFRW